jgi:hypothetical protein
MWPHVRSVFKVTSYCYDNGALLSTKTRFFVSSMAVDELSPQKWLALTVMRWGVETVHQVLDCAFKEDAHPWITKNANGALVVMMLRRLCYALMTLYKCKYPTDDLKASGSVGYDRLYGNHNIASGGSTPVPGRA